MYARAVRRFLEMRRELGDSMGMAFGLNLLGIMAADHGKFRRAAWLTGGASQVWEQLWSILDESGVLKKKKPK